MSPFENGYRAFAKSMGVSSSAFHGASYVENVEGAIDELASAINNPGRKIDKASLDSVKGFMAEKWHAGTHNIDAVIKDVAAKANAVDNNGVVDITTNWNSNYQSKVNANPAKSVSELAISNEGHFRKTHNESNYSDDNPGGLYYDGQLALVASDKISEIERILKERIIKNRESRPDVAANYQQLLDNLTDRVKSPTGSNSIPLSEQEAKLLAQLAKEGGFDPSNWGITTEQLIDWSPILNQAFKAGLSAAVISVVLEVAPALISMIDELIRNGELNADDFKRVGFAALKGSSLGFVRGGVASAITIACEAGKLGTALKGVNPTIIGSVVALTLNALQNATLMAFGKITHREFANQCIQDLFVTSYSLALGSALQTLLPQLPVLSFMLGSFIGSIVGSFVYKTAYSCVMSFCVDTGCTFFGLVEQDYTLSEEVLKEIGIQVFEYERFTPKQFECKGFQAKLFEPKTVATKNITVTFLRRGVIGVNRIGYI